MIYTNSVMKKVFIVKQPLHFEDVSEKLVHRLKTRNAVKTRHKPTRNSRKAVGKKLGGNSAQSEAHL